MKNYLIKFGKFLVAAIVVPIVVPIVAIKHGIERCFKREKNVSTEVEANCYGNNFSLTSKFFVWSASSVIFTWPWWFLGASFDRTLDPNLFIYGNCLIAVYGASYVFFIKYVVGQDGLWPYYLDQIDIRKAYIYIRDKIDRKNRLINHQLLTTGNTPLHIALLKQDPYRVKKLIESGANLTLVNHMGQTAYTLIQYILQRESESLPSFMHREKLKPLFKKQILCIIKYQDLKTLFSPIFAGNERINAVIYNYLYCGQVDSNNKPSYHWLPSLRPLNENFSILNYPIAAIPVIGSTWPIISFIYLPRSLKNLFDGNRANQTNDRDLTELSPIMLMIWASLMSTVSLVLFPILGVGYTQNNFYMVSSSIGLLSLSSTINAILAIKFGLNNLWKQLYFEMKVSIDLKTNLFKHPLQALNPLGDTCLHIAVKQANVERVKACIARGVDLTIRNKPEFDDEKNKMPFDLCLTLLSRSLYCDENRFENSTPHTKNLAHIFYLLNQLVIKNYLDNMQPQVTAIKETVPVTNVAIIIAEYDPRPKFDFTDDKAWQKIIIQHCHSFKTNIAPFSLLSGASKPKLEFHNDSDLKTRLLSQSTDIVVNVDNMLGSDNRVSKAILKHVNLFTTYYQMTWGNPHEMGNDEKLSHDLDDRHHITL